MKKHQGLFVLFALLLALGLTGVALGSNSHGTPPGQEKQSSGSQNNAQSQSGPGVKPSNNTDKNTQCNTGGGSGSSATCTSTNPTTTNADSSKRYGNGKTAAQIANGNGAPSGTAIKGPGNSQPHKVCRNGHWVDVHAAKSYSGSANCSPTSSSSSSHRSSSSGGSVSSSGSVRSGSPGSSVSSGTLGASATAGALGATKALTPKATAGVLGASAALRSSTRSGTLPFTGLSLWFPALAAFGLLAAGLGLRFRRDSV